MGLQSGLLHLILKCDAQQQEQRTQNTHAAQRGLGELAVPLFIIRGGLPNVYGTACAAALRVRTVTMAFPSATAVTVPSASTTATEGSELVHCSATAEGSCTATVGIRSCWLPMLCSKRTSASSVTLPISEVTVTVQVSVSPCVVYALMTALPGASAVTRPLASTEATTGAELLHR